MAGRHKGPLRIVIEDFLETFGFGEIISKWFKIFGEVQELEINAVNEDLMQIIRDTEGMPDAIRKMADFKEGDDMQGGILSSVGFASQVGAAAAGGLLQPIVTILNRSMDDILKTQRPDIQTAITGNRRGLMDEKSYHDALQGSGWRKDYVKFWEDITRPILGVSDLITLWLREEIGETELNIELARLGWSGENVGKIKTLSQIIPGVGDLINMAVREAFNDNTAELFGYDAEFPTQILPFTRAQGLADHWVKRSWRAHWVLPSVGQAFEMLHRLRPGTTDNPFTDKELELLLTALDIPGFWRSKLTEISYNPLTRVDVRRMHAMGKLDRNGVKSAYMDGGLNEKNAELMTEFTEAYNADDKKVISTSKIIEAFKKGLFSESETLDLLIMSGQDQNSAEFYINMAVFDLTSDEIDLEVSLIHELFKIGEKSFTDTHGDLNALDLPETQITILLKRWELEKLKQVRLPSENELEQFYKLGYIDEIDYRSGLSDRNYKIESIDWFINQADQDIAKTAAKVETDAIELKEKLELDILTSDYRIARSGLDVQIAAEKANIAELKLLAYEIDDEDVLAEMKIRIVEIQLIIKEYQLQKAGLKLSEEIETKPEEE